MPLFRTPVPDSLGQQPMATSLPVTIASDQTSVPVAVTGTVTTNLQANTAVRSIVLVGNVSILILAANPLRKGFILTNLGGTNLFVSFGTAPTTANYQIALSTSVPNERFEQMNTVYTGDIFAIRASGSTNVSITEFT